MDAGQRTKYKGPGTKDQGHSSGLLPDGSNQPELGTVVAEHRFQVVGPRLGEGLDGLKDFDGTRGAGQFRALANVEEVELERFNRLGHGFARLGNLAESCLTNCIGGNDVGGDLGLHLDQLEVGCLVFGGPPVHDRAIAEAKVLQLPEQAGRRVSPGSEIAEKGIRSATEASARVADGQAGHEGSKLGLLPAEQRGLNQLLGIRQLRAMLQALNNQVVRPGLRRG